MIYLDNHATTACDLRVIESMAPYYTDYFGNASSDHPFGQVAADAVFEAMQQINFLINGPHGDLVFTSGATESNNIVLIGLAMGHLKRTGKKGKIITTLIEHRAILSPLKYLENEGWKIEYLAVDATGLIDLVQAANMIDGETLVVSVQLANSEIGTIQPIRELAELAHAAGALLHTDAAQAVGKIKFDVYTLDVDLVSFSAHKIYGPKGIGALWMKAGLDKIIQPIMFGGNSGSPLRPGTMPVQLVIGFGKACELSSKELSEGDNRLSLLRDHLEYSLLEKIPGLIINGNQKQRLPNNLNLTFPGVEAEMLLANLREVIASTGSACESGSIEPSRVLLSIGLTREQAYSSIRFGFGRFNTLDEIDIAAQEIVDAYAFLKEALS